MKTKEIQELYQIKLHSMDTILHQISLMDQVENEQELSEIIHSLLQAIGNYTGGFISNKSKHGKELTALELPGLSNGAMTYCNTVFVDWPLITCNPVKTVNDLLRDQHQAKA